MLPQTTYSGWKFIPELFPDLTPNLLLSQIKDFLGYDKDWENKLYANRKKLTPKP